MLWGSLRQRGLRKTKTVHRTDSVLRIKPEDDRREGRGNDIKKKNGMTEGEGVCDKVITDKIPFVVEEKIGDVVVGADTTCAEGTNDVTFAFNNTLEEDVDLKCEGITCPEGTSCAAGRCLCSNNWEKCGDIYCAETEICTTSGTEENSQCYISEGECTRNEDCKTPDGRVDITKYCTFENPVSSVHPGEGTCQDKQALPEKCVAWIGNDGETVYTLEEAGENPICTWKTYGKGEVTYTFWSAKNMCLAHGKKMLDISNNRLKCFNPNAGVSGGQKCCESSYNDCAGYFITEGKSKQAAAFMRAYGAKEFWGAPDYTDEKSFYVSFVDAAIHLRPRKNRAGLLCE